MKVKTKHIKIFKEALKKENLKFTNQRFIVFETLVGNEGHFDCEDIIQMIRKNGRKASRATVYRTLDILVKYGLASKFILDDGIARYEHQISRDFHDHIIDIESNDIIEFHSDELDEMITKIAKDSGYEVVKNIHQLFVKKIKK